MPGSNAVETDRAPVFPYAALVGLQKLKRALLLVAVDPKIGGLLIEGPRGTAKSTAARSLASLMDGPFFELPLGASSDNITGSLDVAGAVSDSEVRFQPGILARAHGGLLYIDEVNLLADDLVDLLLDAAASGFHRVERDGFSHVHRSRFLLVGSMNPQEGSLRPQLLDRFGLSVDAGEDLSDGDRTQIMLRHLEFSEDPAVFNELWQASNEEVGERLRQAREQLPGLQPSEKILTHIAGLSRDAGVEGVRADFALLRAARAKAALAGDSELSLRHVDAVADMALRHRRRQSPPASRPGSSARPRAGDTRSTGAETPPENDDGNGAAKGASSQGGDGGDRLGPVEAAVEMLVHPTVGGEKKNAGASTAPLEGKRRFKPALSIGRTP